MKFIAGLFFLWLLTAKSYPVICNDVSRLAAMESIAERGTHDISESFLIGTCDKVRIPAQGQPAQYFSDKPPMLNFLGSFVYTSLSAIGLDPRLEMEVWYKTTTFIFVVLPWFLFLLFLNKPWYVSAVLSLGTLVLPYLGVLNNHVGAAAWLGLLYLNRKKSPLLCFVLCALMASWELMLGIFVPFFIIENIIEKLDWKKSAALILGLILPTVYTLILFYEMTGRWSLAIFQPESYLYAGSVFSKVQTFGGNEYSVFQKIKILWHMTFGYRGIISHSLISGFSVWAAYKVLSRRSFWILALPSLSILFFLSFVLSSFGGSSFGSRYLLPVSVLWVLAGMPWIMERLKNIKAVVLCASIAIVSIFSSAAGVQSPWLIHAWDSLELNTWDFRWAFEKDRNPYVAPDLCLNKNKKEFENFRSEFLNLYSIDAGLNLSSLYIYCSRISEGMAIVQILEERSTEAQAKDVAYCLKAISYEKFLKLPDLAEKYKSLCKPEVLNKLSDKTQ